MSGEGKRREEKGMSKKELHESTAAVVYLCPCRYFSVSPQIFTPLSLSQSASAAEKIADMEKFSLKSIAQSQQAVNMSFDTMNALVSTVQTPKSAIAIVKAN